MRRAGLFGLAAVLVLLAGGWLVLNSGPDELPSKTVLNCTGDGACTETTITTTLESCTPWYVGEPGGPDCNRTTTGVRQVALITDPANHVPGPMATISFDTRITDEDLARPWDLEFTAEGMQYVTLKNGGLVRGTGTSGSYVRVGSIDVLSTGTGGLLGLALDPEFHQNRRIYVFYTYGRHPEYGRYGILMNRISRFRVTEDGLRNETVLVDAIPGNRLYDGGRLEIGPDGRLYATTGGAPTGINGSVKLFSQNRSSLSGKILRLSLDGSVPTTNPFNGSLVYSFGHKNPSSLVWSPVSGALYASEHGIWRHDEVNKIKPGQNYGFGFFLCDERNPAAKGMMADVKISYATVNNTPPVWCAEDWTMAPGGAAFVRDPDSRLYGDLFVAGLRGKHLRRLDLEDGKLVGESIAWLNDDPIGYSGISHRLRDVEWFNGSLWVTGDGMGIARLTP